MIEKYFTFLNEITCQDAVVLMALIMIVGIGVILWLGWLATRETEE